MKGKVIFITGAASGIGKATARKFAEAGASVMLAGLEPELLETVAASFIQEGYQTSWCECDVTKEEQVKKAINHTVETFGRLDYAYNNAGIMSDPTETVYLDISAFDRVLYYGYAQKIPIISPDILSPLTEDIRYSK